MCETFIWMEKSLILEQTSIKKKSDLQLVSKAMFIFLKQGIS